MRKKQVPDYDENVQLKVYCLRNRWHWYLERMSPKMDPRFNRCRIFTQRSGAAKALKIYRERFKDDSIAIIPMMLTQLENE